MSPTVIAFLVCAAFQWGNTAATPSFSSVPGCYPPYKQGKVYFIADWVSVPTTTTTSVSYVACSPGQGTCPLNGWRQEGGITTTATHNYQCHSDTWCSNSGYAPGSVYSDVAWTKEVTVCTVRDVAVVVNMHLSLILKSSHTSYIFYSSSLCSSSIVYLHMHTTIEGDGDLHTHVKSRSCDVGQSGRMPRRVS